MFSIIYLISNTCSNCNYSQSTTDNFISIVIRDDFVGPISLDFNCSRYATVDCCQSTVSHRTITAVLHSPQTIVVISKNNNLDITPEFHHIIIDNQIAYINLPPYTRYDLHSILFFNVDGAHILYLCALYFVSINKQTNKEFL